MASNNTRANNLPVQVVLETEDSDAFRELMGVVGNANLTVDTKDVRTAQLSPESSARVDLGVLTDKQRRTLELALREGYYERPRESNLTDLAEQLDLSKSAVSQRLRTAERKLIKATLGQYS